jgi:hypothetical protein
MPIDQVFSKTCIWALDVAGAPISHVPEYIQSEWQAEFLKPSHQSRIEIRMAGAWSHIHLVGGGYVMYLRQLYGRQIIFWSDYDNLMDGSALAHMKMSFARSKYQNLRPWRFTVLEPGCFVLIPPSKVIGVYTLSNSIASVHHWLQLSTLHLTELALHIQHSIANVADESLPLPISILKRMPMEQLHLRPIQGQALYRLLSITPTSIPTKAEEIQIPPGPQDSDVSDEETFIKPPVILPPTIGSARFQPAAFEETMRNSAKMLHDLYGSATFYGIPPSRATRLTIRLPSRDKTQRLG